MLASANVLSSIINKINNNKKTVFALLDLKKAFNFISHKLLLIKWKHYGIRSLPLFWLSSYLSNKSQSVKVNGCFSKYQSVSAGVPQSSILGPIFYLIYLLMTYFSLILLIVKFIFMLMILLIFSLLTLILICKLLLMISFINIVFGVCIIVL